MIPKTRRAVAEMNIEEMFPTKPEQTLAQRIIEVLQEHPNRNATQIGEYLWQRTRICQNRTIYQALKNLQSLNTVTCRIKRRPDTDEYDFCETDYFTLTSNAKEALKTLYSLHKAAPYKPPVSRGARYIVFLCGKCGAAVGARNSQKSASCTRCNYKNPIDEKLEVLLKTNNMYEMQSAIKMAKFQGSPEVDSLPPFTPENPKKPKS